MKRATPPFLQAARATAIAIASAASVLLAAPDARAQDPAAPPARPRESADEVTPPTVTTHVDAQYPPSARAVRKHGDVTLALTVDADGHVSKIDVVESGGAVLDEAAIIAARLWSFVPA